MPKAHESSSIRKASQPFSRLPLLLRIPSSDRKILVPRLESYQDMVALAKRKLEGLSDVPAHALIIKSTSIPGLEGEKVEISEEAWPDVIGQLRSFEVDTTSRNRTEALASDASATQRSVDDLGSYDREEQRPRTASSSSSSSRATPASAPSPVAFPSAIASQLSASPGKSATTPRHPAGPHTPSRQPPTPQSVAGPSRPRKPIVPSSPEDVNLDYSSDSSSVDALGPSQPSFAPPSVLVFGQATSSRDATTERRATTIIRKGTTASQSQARLAVKEEPHRDEIRRSPSIIDVDSDSDSESIPTIRHAAPHMPPASKSSAPASVYRFTTDDLKTCKAPQNFKPHEVFKSKTRMSDCLDMQIPNGAFYTAKCHSCQKNNLPCQKIRREEGGGGRKCANCTKNKRVCSRAYLDRAMHLWAIRNPQLGLIDDLKEVAKKKRSGPGRQSTQSLGGSRL